MNIQNGRGTTNYIFVSDFLAWKKEPSAAVALFRDVVVGKEGEKTSPPSPFGRRKKTVVERLVLSPSTEDEDLRKEVIQGRKRG